VTPARFGPFALAPGVARSNMAALLFGAFATIGLVTTVAVLTPYLLSQTLGVPEAAQGRALGGLAVLNELVLIAAYGPLGALADRVGRRVIYAAGFAAMAAAYLLFPFAGSLGEFGAVRALYALGAGAATGMYATLIADYVREDDRGKLAGIGGMLNGLGIVLLALGLGALPAALGRVGFAPEAAARLTCAAAAALCLGVALALWAGLRRDRPEAGGAGRPGMAAQLREGLRVARRDPEVALACAAAFVARGDLVIVGLFTIAWGKLAATQAGMAPAEAIEAGRLPFVIAQGAALLWPLAVIWFVDRLPRVQLLGWSMALGSIGYLGMRFVGDPLAGAAIPWFCLLGVGQISAVLGAQTLIGKAAPEASRGAVIGLFNFAGAVGILVLSALGGWAFDHWGPASPFLIVGALNGLVALAAIPVARRVAGGATREASEPSGARRFEPPPV
jgi:MFS family permease